MRTAIFSDVHGNLTALEAVLEAIKQQEVDLILFAGDLCTDGARPAACVARLRAEDIACVTGNTDQALYNQPLLSNDIIAEEQRRVQRIKDNRDWTWAQLDFDTRAWLGTLPFQRRVSPTPHPKDDLFVVHANPLNLEQHIYPSPEMQQKLYAEIKQPDDDPALRKMLAGFESGILAFGHLHIPNIRYWQDLVLANISSVSRPLDGDPRAKYGLFTWDKGWTITHQYVEYDIEAELQALSAFQPPGWEDFSRQLQTGRESPSPTQAWPDPAHT